MGRKQNNKHIPNCQKSNLNCNFWMLNAVRAFCRDFLPSRDICHRSPGLTTKCPLLRVLTDATERELPLEYQTNCSMPRGCAKRLCQEVVLASDTQGEYSSPPRSLAAPWPCRGGLNVPSNSDSSKIPEPKHSFRGVNCESHSVQARRPHDLPGDVELPDGQTVGGFFRGYSFLHGRLLALRQRNNQAGARGLAACRRLRSIARTA